MPGLFPDSNFVKVSHYEMLIFHKSNLGLSTFKGLFTFTGNDCSKPGDDLFGNDLNFCGDKTDTNHECQLLCQQTTGCVQFTWLGYDTPGREKECCLKNAVNNNPGVLSTVISGPESCPVIGRSCQELKDNSQSPLSDGEYDILLEQNGPKARIYCHNMLSSPAEFLTLRTGPTENYAIDPTTYQPAVAQRGSTTFSKVRINLQVGIYQYTSRKFVLKYIRH